MSIKTLLQKRQTNTRKKGFTVVELMIIVAVIAVVTVLVAPSLIRYIDNSRAQKDESAMDELVEAVRLQVANDKIFDEVYYYSIANNFLTYSDSTGHYGSKEMEGEFWAPDGSGRATTITFNPEPDGRRSKYVLSDALVNDMTYKNGSIAHEQRIAEGCSAYPSQANFNEMVFDDNTKADGLYHGVRSIVGESINIKSAMYRNSSYTVFIAFKVEDGTRKVTVTGSFNGKNLEQGSVSSIGSGTEQENGDPTANGGTQSSDFDASSLAGGGSVSYKSYDTFEDDILDTNKFINFCKSVENAKQISFIAKANKGGTDVSKGQSGTIYAWLENDIIYCGVADGEYKVLADTNCDHMFDANTINQNDLIGIDVSLLDTRNASNMSSMFKGNKNVTRIRGLESLITNNVTDMSYMFSDCEKLSSASVQKWETSKVESFAYMFANCKTLKSLNVGALKTESANNMSHMFYNCVGVGVLDVSRFDTKNVTDFSAMFSGCTSVAVLDVTAFDTSLAERMPAMFKNMASVETLNVANFDTKKVTSMNGMFAGCKQLKDLDVSLFNTESLTDTAEMFKNCQNIKVLDLTDWSTLRCSNVDGMFDGMIRLEEISVGTSFSFYGNGSSRCILPTPSNVYIQGAFGMWIDIVGNSYAAAEIPNRRAATYFAVANTLPAKLAPAFQWYRGETDPSTIEYIYVTNSYRTSARVKETFNADIDNAGEIKCYVEDNILYIVNKGTPRAKNAIVVDKNASNMFSAFTNVKSINGLKLLNLSNVTSATQMFGKYESGRYTGCTKLTYMNGYENWNVQSITNANQMFSCLALPDLNLNKFKFTSLTNASSMFEGNNSQMINCDGWDVSKIKDFRNMFADANKLKELSISGWNTSSQQYFGKMFSDCTSLEVISASQDFKVNVAADDMFENCTKIVGGEGTRYSSGSSSFAKIDGANPGYFTGTNTVGKMSAKWYAGSSVSSSYTLLTPSGTKDMGWNYYNGARMLEINLSELSKNKINTVTVTVPAGVYIVKNSWTTSGDAIQDVSFKTLDTDSTAAGYQQGTGKYSNEQTGTLTFTIAQYATNANIQCMVNMDHAIWDKNKNTGSMTNEPPITVTLDGEITQKISQTHSLSAIGRSGDYGFTYHTDSKISALYIGEEAKFLTSSQLLAVDQSTNPYFYKTIDVTCSITSKDASGNTIYGAFTTDGTTTSHQGKPQSVSQTGGQLKAHWDNAYASSTMSFLTPSVKLLSSDGFIDGQTATFKSDVKLVSLSGQIRTLSYSKSVPIKGTDLNYDDFVVGASGASIPPNSFYGSGDGTSVAGYSTVYYKGYSDISGVKMKYVYDSATSSGAPKLLVDTCRVACPSGKKINAKVTLIDNSGSTYGPYTYEVTSNSDSAGCLFNAKTVASKNSVTKTVYIKQIEYEMPTVTGSTTNHYLYGTGGSKAVSSAGSFTARASENAKFQIIATMPNGTTKKAENTVKVTQTPSSTGYVSSVSFPNGSTITAGNDFELTACIEAINYPYANTQLFTRPELYFILPIGIDINDAIIGSSASITTSETESVISVVKKVEINGTMHNVYRIKFTNDVYFGYYKMFSNYSNVGAYRKYVRMSLSADATMDTTNIVLKERLLFKDEICHVTQSGSYQKATATDTYDVDNDGSTADKYGVLTTTDAQLTIRGQ